MASDGKITIDTAIDTKELEKGLKDLGNVIKDLGEKIGNEAEAAGEKAGKEMGAGLAKEAEKGGKKGAKEVKDELEKGGKKAGADAGKKTADEFNKGLSKLADGAKKAVAGLATVIAGATTAAVGLGTAAIKVGMDFDAKASQYAATMGTTVDQIGAIIQSSKELGASTAFSGGEVLDTYNVLAQAGLDVETQMQSMTAVLDLAAAGNMELADAANYVTGTMNAMGIEASGTTAYVDKLAVGATASNASVAELGEGMTQVGGFAKTLSGGVDEAITALGVLHDANIKGSESGTQLRTIIRNLTGPAGPAADAIAELGLEVKDAEGNMRPLDQIMGDLDEKLAGLGDVDRAKVLSTIFDSSVLGSADALMQSATGRFGELKTAIANSDGAAKKMADTMRDNLAGKVEGLGGALETLAIETSEDFMEDAGAVVQGLTDIVDGLTKAQDAEGLEGLAEALGASLAEMAAAAGKAAPDIINAATLVIKGFVTTLTSEENSGELANAAIAIIKAIVKAIGDLGGDLAAGVIGILPDIAANIPDTLGALVDAAEAILAGIVTGMTNSDTLNEGVILALNGLAAAIVGIGTGLLLYRAASGVGNIISSITSAFDGLVTVLKGNPVLAALSVGGALLTAAIGFASAVQNDIITVYSDLQEANDALATSIDTASGTIKESAGDYAQESGEIVATQRKVNDLISELDTLMAKTNRTGDDRNRIVEIVAQLNSLIPNLALAYDDETDSLNKNMRAIQDNANARMLSMLDTASNDALAKLLDTQLKLTSDYNAAQAELAPILDLRSAAESNLANAIDAVNEALYNEGKAYETTFEAFTSMNDSEAIDYQRELGKVLEDMGWGSDFAAGMVQQLADAYTDYDTTLGEIEPEIERSKELEKEYAEAMADSEAEINNVIASRNKLAETMIASNSETQISAEMMAGLGKALGTLGFKIAGVTDDFHAMRDAASEVVDPALLEETAASIAGLVESYRSLDEAMLASIANMESREGIAASLVLAENAQAELLAHSGDLYTQFYNTASEAMEKLPTVISDGTEKGTISLQDMVDNLEHNNTALQNYSDMLQDLASKGASGEVIKFFEDLGVAGTESLDQLIKAYENEDPEELAAKIEKYIGSAAETAQTETEDVLNKTGDQMLNYIVDGIEDNKEFQNKIDGIMASSIETLITAAKADGAGTPGESLGNSILAALEASLNATDGTGIAALAEQMLTDTKPIGENAMQGATEGVSENSDKFLAGVATTIVEMVNLAKALLQINSPSKVFAGIGENTALGMEEGIASGESGVTSAAEAIVNAAVDAVQGVEDDFRASGRAMMDGLISGIRSRGVDAIAAARDIANKIADIMRQSWDIHSPSRVFADIGADAMAGLAAGAKRASGDVVGAFVDAADTTADEAYKSFADKLELLIRQTSGVTSAEIAEYLDGLKTELDQFADAYAEIFSELEKEFDKFTAQSSSAAESVMDDLDKKIQALQDKIDERDALREKERNEKREAELRKAVADAQAEVDALKKNGKAKQDEKDRAAEQLLRAQEQLNEYLRQMEDQAYKDALNAQIEALEAQKEAAEQADAEERERLREQYEAEKAQLEAMIEANEKYLEEKKRLHEEEMQALEDAKQAYVDNLNDTGEAIMEALKERYSQMLDAEKEALDEQLRLAKEASDARLELLEEEYKRRADAIDADARRAIDALQDEIDALEEVKRAQDDKADEEAFLKAKADREREIANAKTRAEKAKAEDALAKLIADYNRKQQKNENDRARADLKEKQDAIRDQADQQKDALEDQLDAQKEYERQQLEDMERFIDSEKMLIEQRYAEKMTAQALYHEAEKMILNNQQQEIYDLLKTYNPAWYEAGQDFGRNIIEGIDSMEEAINQKINTTLSALENLRSLQSQAAQAGQDYQNILNNAQQQMQNSNPVYNRPTYTPTIIEGSPSGLGSGMTINFNQPVSSPSETARQIETVNRRLALGY